MYDEKRKDDLEGLRPLYKPSYWQSEERKLKKKHSWMTIGESIAMIFVPSTMS